MAGGKRRPMKDSADILVAMSPSAGETFELGIFPLTGTMLLPGGFLPLNIFEPRYRALVCDSLAADRRIGMIQPRRPSADNFGPISGAPENPEIYGVGCVGEIGQAELQPDGRYLIVLEGIERFEVLEEIAGRNGYRRVLATSGRFPVDRDPGAEPLDPQPLLAAVARLAERGILELDVDLLAALPAVRLLNGLCAALPLDPAEKQALLEVETAAERQELLLAFLDMGADSGRRPPYVEPAVN